MSQLSEELEQFRSGTAALLAEGQTKAESLPPNTTQVWPGGARFNSIQAAINSISDAGPGRQYHVVIGPGTYNERVNMKEYVLLSGAGQNKTFITQPGLNDYAGTIQAVGNSGIGTLTVVASGGGWGAYPVAMLMLTPGKFHASGVNFNATDSGNAGNNVRAISNNTGAETGFVILGSCVITATAQNGQSTPVAVEGVESGFSYYMDLCTISTVGAGWGVSTAAGANATLEGCKITAAYYALYNSDNASLITAHHCVIDGLVSPGVVVDNGVMAASAQLEQESAPGAIQIHGPAENA